MNKQATLDRIQEIGLIAVLRGTSLDLTLKMVDALIAGSIRGIEITYTTPNAPQIITQLASQYGDDLLLGMGTLTEPYQAQEAVDAGAKFLVSPHCDPELANAMVKTGAVIMMGALTPSEVKLSHKLGSDVVKVFPAGAIGGADYLRFLKGPFPNIPMMPTGGVTADNLTDWFDAGAVAVGAGSTLCPTHLALDGRFSEITETAKSFIQVLGTIKR